MWCENPSKPRSQAMRYSIQGRPGVSYIDLPGEMIRSTVEDDTKIK